MISVTRVYSDVNGESHFEDIEISLADQGSIGYLSEVRKVEGLIFREVKPDYDYDFHNAPQKQYIILVEGGVEIETSLGEKRQFPTGSILLVEDISGKGHRTRNLEPKLRKSIFVTL